MPSLCSYDSPGSKSRVGKTYLSDIEAGNTAFRLFLSELRKSRTKTWQPECHFYMGNHEDRITRAVEFDPRLEGMLSLELLKTPGFQRHPFLQIHEIDGVAYSHYFYNLKSGRPIGGLVSGRINKIGRSFVAGHEQSINFGTADYPGFRRIGVVAGSFYQHDPEYRGPQAKSDWRGIVILNEVHRGEFGLMDVSLKYLEQRYG